MPSHLVNEPWARAELGTAHKQRRGSTQSEPARRVAGAREGSAL